MNRCISSEEMKDIMARIRKVESDLNKAGKFYRDDFRTRYASMIASSLFSVSSAVREFDAYDVYDLSNTKDLLSGGYAEIPPIARIVDAYATIVTLILKLHISHKNAAAELQNALLVLDKFFETSERDMRRTGGIPREKGQLEAISQWKTNQFCI